MPEAFWFPCLFKGYKMGTWPGMGWYKQVPNQRYVQIYNLIWTYYQDLFVVGRVHKNIKNTNNTKMNRIFASFRNHCNSIFIDRVPYKHRNWLFHGALIIAFQIILFSLHMYKVIFFSLKIWKTTSPPQVTSWNIQNLALKKHVPSFSKNSTLHENIKICWLKQRLRNFNFNFKFQISI